MSDRERERETETPACARVEVKPKLCCDDLPLSLILASTRQKALRGMATQSSAWRIPNWS